jgi:hypothetical protein
MKTKKEKEYCRICSGYKEKGLCKKHADEIARHASEMNRIFNKAFSKAVKK